ncbi:Eco57I restriction-modification methylase domain-containing protein [Thioalkalivibrio sp. HK1]|uniref:Eco57I restriction-modification methylase domain-containing protein n=1 Tax=Thioalkalivibrio sp. HK1 TaxID=1469245 RepID=UPI0004716F46|nr:DNA methyltransferase [Thioalkalivibrio sp. HK1]
METSDPLHKGGGGVDKFSPSIDIIAEKHGFYICVCEINKYPLTKDIKRKLANDISKQYYENLLILLSENQQCWILSIRPQNRPRRIIEVVWREDEDPQKLLEKIDGIFFDISEENELHLTDVVDRVRDSFIVNSEKVTSRFYKEFKSQLSEFRDFIAGIHTETNREWYAALMLNRLMFIYFIQKKSFLDGDKNYLRNRLRRTQEEYGKNEFEKKFYRVFLRVLFLDGLGTPTGNRSKHLENTLGRIPYLNGGLFDIHEIEKENEDIEIPDAAFEKLFDFFDKYNWHLDDRITASGKDINPDVIGYIFEKYINERSKMGAYYTQEDITNYISRNTILPCLLDKVKESCKSAFYPDNGIWKLLRENPNNYIYPSIQKGCDIPDKDIPDHIEKGLDIEKSDVIARREFWNDWTPDRFGLPRETWRDTIARRKYYFSLKRKIENGEINEVEDLVTYNLDIERLVLDILDTYEKEDFIKAFYEAISGRSITDDEDRDKGIKILDPACGSGAFLFAALNILEPLYERCIDRMRGFVENDDLNQQRKKNPGTKETRYSYFRSILEDIDRHPNPRYWIYREIILNNLYGVDLMREAAEIAKLRLFLKLAAEANYDPKHENYGLEPLPDIDYNIRSGNSLVGFADMDRFKQITGGEFDFHGYHRAIEKKFDEIKEASDLFRKSQSQEDGFYRPEKKNLETKLSELNREMNNHLSDSYGIGEDDIDNWISSHNPFHWITEFYSIIEQSGGFDVVIGNPPYIKYSVASKEYDIPGYDTQPCDNLYAMFIERADHISSDYMGMIVQLPLVCTDRMMAARDILSKYHTHYLTFDDAPSKLFKDLTHIRVSIFLTKKGSKDKKTFSTKYNRWYQECRNSLFQSVNLHRNDHLTGYFGTVPKIGNDLEASIYHKIMNIKGRVGDHSFGGNQCYFHNAATYWIHAIDFVSYFWNERDGEKMSSGIKPIAFDTREKSIAVCLILNSSLFYWWYIVVSDCRHLNMRDIVNFPVDLNVLSKKSRTPKLISIHDDLMANFKKFKTTKSAEYPRTTGRVEYDEFHPSHAKSIIDRIDRILAEHYGFTEEELDYIINFDIKYRMGKLFHQK